MKKIVFFLFALFASSAFAQSGGDSLKGIKKTNKHGVVELACNVKDDLPDGKDFKEKIMNYLLSKSKELHKGESAELKYLKTVVSPAGKTVGFIQTYKGVPVLGSEAAVHVNKNNEVTFVNNHYKPGINISINPKITSEEAINVSIKSFDTVEFATTVPNKVELSIYEDNIGTMNLVWKINILPEFGGDWYFLIDANTKAILVKENIELNSISGTGKVFNPDPGSYFEDYTLPDNNDVNYFSDQTVYRFVALPGLNNPVNGYYYLRGEYAYSMDIAYPSDAVAYNNNPGFSYTRNQNGFEETNCYYHLDQFIRYVRDLGYEPQWANQTSNTDDIVFDARGESGINAHYYPSSDYITYGVPSSNVDAGEDHSIIIHELGHALHDALMVGGSIGGHSDKSGIGEGISDYLGIDYRRQLSTYRPNARCNWFYPTADNTIKSIFEVNFDIWWDNKTIYQQMQTWASSLMDLEYIDALDPSQGYRLGRDIVHTLLFESIKKMTASNSKESYIFAMYQADIDIYDGDHLRDLIEVYHNRLMFNDQLIESNITSSTTWEDYKMISGDLSVSAGNTLTLAPSSVLVLDSDLTIASGASLVVGDNVQIFGNGYSINVVGNMYISSSSDLVMDENTTLNFANGMLTNNYGGVLEMNGNISVGQNKTGTIKGSGYMVLNGDINAETGATLTIQGVGKSTKCLEIAKKINFDTDFASVTIKNGKVVMNTTSSELYMYSGIDAVTIENVLVTSSSGSRNNHKGIDIRCSNFSIKNSTFNNGYYGVCLIRSSSAPAKDIRDCTFNNNSVGIYTGGGVYNISDCNLTSNAYNLYFAGYGGTSNVYSCTIDGGNYGIFSLGINRVNNITFSTIKNCNNNGIQSINPSTWRIQCSNIFSNSVGLSLTNGSIAYFATQGSISAGNNSISGNNYGVIGGGSTYTNYFYANNGYNYLKNSSYGFVGNFYGISAGYYACNNNTWRSNGGTPRYGYEYYMLKGSSGGNLYLTDNSANSGFMPCHNFSKETNDEKDLNIDFLQTSTLGTSIAKAIELDDKLDTKKRYESFTHLANLLLADVKLSRTSEKFALQTAYHYMYQQWNQFYSITDNMDKSLSLMQQVQQKLFNETNDKGLKATYAVGYAQTLMVAQQFNKAIEYLNKVSGKFDGDNLLFIEGIICQAKIYSDLANNPDMQEEIPELLEKCVTSDINLKSGRIAVETEPEVSEIFENITLDIVPHPVAANSTIVVSGLEETGKIEIYNTVGAKVFTEDVDSEVYNLYISNETYKPGIYLITLRVNGQVAKTTKMVVVE